MASRIEELSRSTAALDIDPQDRERVFDSFRRWGYLQAQLDPLGQYLSPVRVTELEVEGEAADQARRIYSGTVGAEFMHIPDPERRRWIQERLESESEPVDQQRILDLLVKADAFEQVIQSRYLGTKRFSLEGVTGLIPFLDQMLQRAAEHEAMQIVFAMAHRGRLNVMVNIMGKAPSDIFAKFEDVDPRSVLGGGDVKYHIGATGVFEAKNGRGLNVHLVSNPSHLEVVGPVALGRTRAKQYHLGEEGVDKVLPIIMHGDSAFAGQGVTAEALDYASVPGYDVGGSIHVIINNLIGFTTEPHESSSSRFASDLAKRLPIPIFHVNSEDADAVVRVARLALEYRYSFGSDVVVDLIGYRRHGHSEVDDPTITQPVRYARIKDHPQLWQIYAQQLGVDVSEQFKAAQAGYNEAQKKATKLTKMPVFAHTPSYWDNYVGGPYKPEYEVNTSLSPEEIAELTRGLTTYPSDFAIHPKIKKLLDQRADMGAGKKPIDFGMAEALAYGSLVKNGVHVRLSGQDSQRGTFNHRHAVLFDINDEHPYIPLNHVAADQAKFEVYNSILSEAAVMAYEYGYSRDYPDSLVLWEAQFGDFANGAQIIIDQFISSGEDKWGLLSGLVLLLPHGYEGQGPEHSSARIERYLQLAARDNMQITQPSTAAQFFHLLRRQALRKWRKPLIVFTPKSMLRHPDAMSPIEDFQRKHFLNVLPETEIQNADRIVVCTGKIGREIRAERKKRQDTTTAVVFLEQMYPFPEGELALELDRHANAKEIVWVQEEPANQGAMWFVVPKLKKIANGRPVLTVKRSASSSPATGSAKAHEMEQKTLIDLALGGINK